MAIEEISNFFFAPFYESSLYNKAFVSLTTVVQDYLVYGQNIPCSSCATNAVNIFLNVTWKIKIDDVPRW